MGTKYKSAGAQPATVSHSSQWPVHTSSSGGTSRSETITSGSPLVTAMYNY